MNKPLLSKEQAQAIECIKQKMGDGTTIAYNTLAEAVEFKLTGNLFTDDREPANGISNDYFISALYVGYEVDLSPEERVKELYDAYRDATDEWDSGVTFGIEQTLQALEISIEGVTK